MDHVVRIQDGADMSLDLQDVFPCGLLIYHDMGSENMVRAIQRPDVCMVCAHNMLNAAKAFLDGLDIGSCGHALHEYPECITEIFQDIEQDIGRDQAGQQWIKKRYIPDQEDEADSKDSGPPENIL